MSYKEIYDAVFWRIINNGQDEVVTFQNAFQPRLQVKSFIRPSGLFSVRGDGLIIGVSVAVVAVSIRFVVECVLCLNRMRFGMLLNIFLSI